MTPDITETPTTDNRLDFTFVLMGQLATVLSSQRATAERYNACAELAILMHPFQDAAYRAFAARYFRQPIETRVRSSGAWLRELMDLLYRAGFLGRGDRGE